MCIFHVTSKTDSFKGFLEEYPDIPVYQRHEKGDLPQIGPEEAAYEDYGFSCDVSDRPWHDVEGQIVDMISFLEVYQFHLELMRERFQIHDWRFDLPYECRLDEQVFTQSELIPPKLMRLAGALDISIELSLYWPNELEEPEELEENSADADASTDS